MDTTNKVSTYDRADLAEAGVADSQMIRQTDRERQIKRGTSLILVQNSKN